MVDNEPPTFIRSPPSATRNRWGASMDAKRMKMKICLVGEAAVGKTSLIRRFVLDDLDDWIEGVYSVTGRIPIQFLANKADLKDRGEFGESEIRQAARAYDSPFNFTSAKTGEDVESGFQSLAERIAKERLTRAVVVAEE